MRRDMELVIKILEYLEQRDETSVITRLQLPGYDDRVVAYHARRMYEAGLLDAEAEVSTTTPTRLINVLPFGLTWEGHEFLDSMRNHSVRAKVLTKLGGSLACIPFQIIRELAITTFRSQVGL